MAAQLQEIPLDLIDVGEGFNPRTTVHVDDGFLESVRAHGVLTPILVHPQGSGDKTRYFLVAGGRRLLAARELGLESIAAVVRTEFTNGNALPAALVENMQREQLTPIEEARAFVRAHENGMTLADVAAAVGVSHDLVRDRVALLDLPEAVQAKIDTREVTLAVAKSLETFAAAGPAVVEKVVELLDADYDDGFYGDPILAKDLERDPAFVLEQTLDELARDGAKDMPFIVDAASPGYEGILEAKLPWPKDVDVAALRAKAKQLPDHDGNYRQVRALATHLTDDDLDAARAYGCLLQLGSAGRGRRGEHPGFVTDPVWLADRLNQKLDAAIAKRSKTTTKAKGAAAASATDAEKERKEKARKERAKEVAGQLSARERNLRVGRELFKQLHAPKPTVEGMRAIAELLVTYAGEDLARRGLRFTDEAAQTVTTRKDGSISRVSYPKATVELRELVAGKLAKAETAEEIYGAMLQVIVAAAYADVNAAPSSNRWGEVRALNAYGASRPLVDAVDKIAEQVLPTDLQKKAKRGR